MSEHEPEDIIALARAMNGVAGFGYSNIDIKRAQNILASDWLAARDARIREDALGAVKPDLYYAFEEGVAAERANRQRIEMYRHWSSTSSEPPPATPPNPYRAVIDTPAQADQQ